jgi:hypothetical protein
VLDFISFSDAFEGDICFQVCCPRLDVPFKVFCCFSLHVLASLFVAEFSALTWVFFRISGGFDSVFFLVLMLCSFLLDNGDERFVFNACFSGFMFFSSACLKHVFLI